MISDETLRNTQAKLDHAMHVAATVHRDIFQELVEARALLREAETVLELFTQHSMSEVRPMRGESFIGWQRGEGPSAAERVDMAQRFLDRLKQAFGV